MRGFAAGASGAIGSAPRAVREAVHEPEPDAIVHRASAARASPLADPSAVADVPTAMAAPDRRGDPIAVDRPTEAAARWGMAVVYVMLGYEWLLSGLNKDLSGTFRSGLANRLHGSLVDNPHGWYVSFVERAVLPHLDVFAAATEVGELFVAVGLIWGALLWGRPEWFSVGLRPWLGIAVSAALLGAALMELNYYLLAGQGWPWLKIHDPFIEGLSVDGLVLLISLALIPVQLVAARRSFAREGSAIRRGGRPPRDRSSDVRPGRPH